MFKPQRLKRERRKPYRGAKAFDSTCRNHGSCPWCWSNRTFNYRKRKYFAEKDLRDWEKGDA